MTSDPTVVVAGAGVFGLASALALAGRGVSVILLDPRLGEGNASAVAAGLLAPVSEALFDPIIAPHHELLNAAMALWPGFADRYGLALATDGTVVAADQAGRAVAFGVRPEAHPQGVLIAEEARVADPVAALDHLRAALARAGGRIERRGFAAADLDSADAVVLAAGPGLSAMAHHAPELRHLTPVKGQIAVLPRGPTTGPTLRWPGGYLAPQASGARVGATMELGLRDTTVEPEAIAALIAAAKARRPDLDPGGAYGQAGVRIQAPDALPMVGPSTTGRTYLAAGARRNGWLLAPLVGSIIAAYCMDEDPGPWAARLHPGRFGRSK